MVLNLLAIFVAGFLAWHNFRTGRGDYRGARRLALFILALGLADWLLGEKHSAVLSDEVASLYVWIARVILTATIAWLCYFAVEPYVRKFWPQIMITWSRVLRGKFRDPLLGRDILIGGTCGILLLARAASGQSAARLAGLAPAVAAAARRGLRRRGAGRPALQAEPFGHGSRQ